MLALPVTSLVLGDGTRVAVLSDPPQVGDERGLHALPLPDHLRAKPGELERLGIFFGRDFEPRVGGNVRPRAAKRPFIGGICPMAGATGAKEIGQLGGTVRGALWGVLGTADPELVCRVGAVCIIKRQSGWTTAPAGTSQRSVVLQDGVLWGLDSSGISSIDKRGWALAIPAPAWSAPSALWATRDEAWVSTPRELYHYSAGQWQAVPSPIGEVKSFWGTRPDSIWLAGVGGAAHFDGREFQLVPVAGPLSVVRGRSDADVWFGGEGGLFRIQPAKPESAAPSAGR